MTSSAITYEIRDFTSSDEDVENLVNMWQLVFPGWSIDRLRLEKILRLLPGHHSIHEKGFCLAFLSAGRQGKIAAIGVLPDFRGKGLGTALLERARLSLRDAAQVDGKGELETLEIGSSVPRFWPQMPLTFPQEVKDFFLHRGRLEVPFMICTYANVVQDT